VVAAAETIGTETGAVVNEEIIMAVVDMMATSLVEGLAETTGVGEEEEVGGSEIDGEN